MKNNIKLVSLFAVALISLFSVNSAQAVNPSTQGKIADKKEQIEENKVEKICTRLDNVISRLESKMEGERNSLKERLQNRAREMEETQVTKDSELEQRRVTRDENRERFYSELESKAGEDAAKKVAVEKFRNTVELAIKTRREAIDEAKEKMNNGIELAIKNRNSSVEALRNELENNIKNSITKAKNSCDENVTSEELKNVLAQMKEDIKSDKETYKTEVAQMEKVQSKIQSLREVRKTAVKKAIDDFKSTLKVAQEELKKAMGA